MKNNKGMTLVELIVVLGLMGAVLTLAGTLLLFGNRNFSRQTNITENLSNARYTMNFLTTEVAKAESVEVETNILKVDSSQIRLQGDTLYKDDKRIASGIDRLTITKEGNKLEIIIVIIDKNQKEEKLSSTVYIR